MACSNIGCLCGRLVISQDVTFADDTLLINIPTGAYENGEKYCLIVAQPIPEETTIAARVAITIGDDTTTTYPLVNPNCTNVGACNIRERARYATKVFTNIQDGVFKLLSPLSYSCCSNCNANDSLPITTPEATTTTQGGENG